MYAHDHRLSRSFVWIATIIDLYVICLDSDFTLVLAGYSDASLGGILVDGGDVIANLDGVVGVANIYDAHACVEPGDKEELTVVDGREILIGPMGADVAS